MPLFKLAELLAAWLLMSTVKLFQANQMSRQETKLALDERRGKLGPSEQVQTHEKSFFYFLLLLTLVSQSATEEWLSPFAAEVYRYAPD